MRFVLTVDHAIAAGGLAFCMAVGWHLGRWLVDKLLSLLR
jgi:hypothetical protein